MTDTPTAAQRLVGDIAPELATLTDDVLLGEVWERDAGWPKAMAAVGVVREVFAKTDTE